MELLNIDELSGPERRVTIRGVEYSVVDRSVGLMLDSIRAVKQQTKGNKNRVDEETFFTNIIKTLRTILPECPEEVVRGLSMPQMMAILDFCNQDPNQMAEEAVAEAKAAGNTGSVNDSKVVEPGKV
jgi:hypothetical protein